MITKHEKTNSLRKGFTDDIIVEEKLTLQIAREVIYESSGSVFRGAAPEDDASLPFWFWFWFWLWFGRLRLFATMESLTSPASTSKFSVLLRLLMLL